MASTPLGRWAERHALLIDGVVAALLFLYDAMYLTGQYAGFGDLSVPLLVVGLVLSAGMCVLYPFRRRWPFLVPAVVLATAWGYIALGVGLSPAPLVLSGLVLYFLGTRFSWQATFLAALAVAAWVIVAAQPVLERDYLRIGEVGVLVLTGFFVATVGLFAQARRRHVERLGEVNAQLARERDAQAAIAAAEERARIAREIHDIVSHSLGTMVVMADGAAQTAIADPEQASRAMARVRDTGRGAMGEMRRMLGVLREDGTASRAPQPGLGALERLLEEARGTGLRVDLQVSGVPVSLPAGVDLAAYRIVQEALTNARKHGGPLLSLVTVRVSYSDDAVDLRISDDGVDAATAGEVGADGHHSSGHGLVGMRERASAYGGSLEAARRPGGGFEVHAMLPIEGER
ncbi:MAG TPA: sensor histidine kinase [Candidatus Dietzia intestinigallinarum]|nr:sensor histidine kinase [Candidatus Dietzia intestinigallinarum]